jgi:hypothetical protein
LGDGNPDDVEGSVVVRLNVGLGTLMRDDLSTPSKEVLAKRVGFRCSNPKCGKLTAGPQADVLKAINIGVAAHITAAAPGGPRYDSGLSAKERAGVH